jgi:hypothetical protein
MQPTIGRVVILNTNKANLFNGVVYDPSKPLAAIVTDVRDGVISVTAFPPGKESFPVFEVLSAGNKEEGYPYWEWPEIKKEAESKPVDRFPSDDEQPEPLVKQEVLIVDGEVTKSDEKEKIVFIKQMLGTPFILISEDESEFSGTGICGNWAMLLKDGETSITFGKEYDIQSPNNGVCKIVISEDHSAVITIKHKKKPVKKKEITNK